jgi:periplasmic protein TonB
MEKDTMGAIATQDLSRPRAGEKSSRPQPVCIEVPVTVHCGCLSTDSGKREPFSESTRTIIVFSNGAVLRLRTAVNPGQSIILTNEHTGKKVLCHVVTSKTYQNVAGYIELQFAEPTVGFWGILFPGDGSESQRAPGAAGVSQAASRPQPLPPAAPNTTPPVVSTHSSAACSTNPRMLSPNAPGVEYSAALGSVSTPLAQSPHAVLIRPEVVPLSHAEEHASIADPVVFPLEREAATPAPPAAKPREDDEIAAFINRLMFEEPETESARATPRRSPLIALIAAELLLVAMAGGGWYWWHNRVRVTTPNFFPQSANVATSTSVLAPANTRTTPLVSSTVPETLKTVEIPGHSSAPPENPAESHEKPNEASKKPAAIFHSRLSRPHAKPSSSLAKVPEAAEGIDSAPEISSRVSAEGLSALIAGSGLQPAAPKPERPIGGEVKAALLISSVPPAYPRLARSQGVEGDVTLDALIDVTGRVTKIKTISGPELLQQAAAAAVRQWKYEPATLDGKVVPMHLTVTVKFRTR